MTNSISKKMALAAIDALEDKKAEDIRVIDISEVSPQTAIRYRHLLTMWKNF